jgi:putative acetyltransferase
VKQDGIVLGCAAIKQLSATHGEIKSIRTAVPTKNQEGSLSLLWHLLDVARLRGYQQLSLETGSMVFFISARRLYQRNGFSYCGPFVYYQPDPNSLFMTHFIQR